MQQVRFAETCRYEWTRCCRDTSQQTRHLLLWLSSIDLVSHLHYLEQSGSPTTRNQSQENCTESQKCPVKSSQECIIVRQVLNEMTVIAQARWWLIVLKKKNTPETRKQKVNNKTPNLSGTEREIWDLFECMEPRGACARKGAVNAANLCSSEVLHSISFSSLCRRI